MTVMELTPIMLNLAELTPMEVGAIAVAALIGIAVGFFLTQMVTGNTLKRANEERERLLESAKQEASTLKKETELEAEKNDDYGTRT